MTMTARTSFLTLTAFAALAVAALAPTSASAWGDGHFAERNNPGPGFGGAPNPAATHPSPYVPGATVMPMGGGSCHAAWCRPHNFPSPAAGQTGGSTNQPNNPTWTPGPSAGGSSANPPSKGPTWNPPSNGQGGNGNGGNGPWTGNDEHRPCGYGGCASNWPRPWWRRPWSGPAVYPSQTTYPQAPSYPVPAPTYTAPTYTAPTYTAPTYTAPAPTYVQAPSYPVPAPTYTQAPAPSYPQAPTQTYAPAPTQPVSQNCNCLTKSYMQDGSVVFTDVCTRETAMAAPAASQQAQYGQQQQTSY